MSQQELRLHDLVMRADASESDVWAYRTMVGTVERVEGSRVSVAWEMDRGTTSYHRAADVVVVDRDEILKRLIAEFPPEFGLRAFPGERFRLSAGASYLSGSRAMLCTQRLAEDGRWLDFAKGTADELRGNIAK